MLLPITLGIVTQLSDIKRQKARLEQLKREAEEEKERAREAARERVLQEFEKGQLGLAASTSVATTSGTDSKECMFSHTAVSLCIGVQHSISPRN